MPGWGDNPMPREPFSYVDFAAGFLPGALVGNSFGGAIALRTALAHPDQVDRLVLVGAGLPAWDWTEEMRGYFDAEAKAIDAGDLDGATDVNLDFWVKPEHRDRSGRGSAARSSWDRPRRAGPALAGDGALSLLEMRTLVVVGADDHADSSRSPSTRRGNTERRPRGHPGGRAPRRHRPARELNALLLEFMAD